MTRLQKFSVSLLTTSSMFWAAAAFAQDATGSLPAMAPAQSTQTATDIGTIEVQGAGQALGSGYIIPEDGPKDRSTVTQAGIQNQLPTANPFQLLGILPGVNVETDDAIGLGGGTIRVRGLVASQMGFTINGAPFNDSGTFNVYPSEIIDSENVGQIWLTHGSTDLDAPHVGASGGNIGVVTRAPSDDFNVRFGQTVGELSLVRDYVGLDTGLMGDVKGLVSFSYTSADKWRGGGGDSRYHTDGNWVWQFLPESSIGLTWAYNDAVLDYYRDYASSGIYNVYIPGTPNNKTAYQTYQTIGRDADYDTFWGSSAAYPVNLSGPFSSSACATHPNPGCTVTNPQFPQTAATNASNDYKLNVNPYRDLVTTIPLHVQVNQNLRWETNAYLWWGEGGATFGSTSLTEGSYTNGYKVGPTYGNAANATNALLTTESTVNQTFRPGLTTKVVYDVDNYSFMAGGWWEHAHLHYDQPFGLVNSNLTPCDQWLTEANNNACAVQGTSVNGASAVYASNYVADSVGESVYGEAQGRFLNDALKITVGIADRAIIREVHNYNPICADDPALTVATGSNNSCSSYATSTAFLESSAYQFFNGPSVGSAAAYAAMRQYGANPHAKFQAWLPEFNGSYDIDGNQQIFAGLSTGFRSPSVGNFAQFTSANTATGSNIMKIADVKSEYAASWEAGYRWHDDFMQASATAYLQDVKNYQASVQIDPADYITANIGGVKIYGIDAEAGTRPWHGFTFYVSGELQKSRIAQNLAADFSGTYPNDIIQYVATRGKELVDTPDWMLSASIGYSQDGFFGELIPQCRGQRATSLLNDEWVPGYCTLNVNAGYHFGTIMDGAFKNATLQLYAVNATDTKYFGQIYTQGQTNALPAQGYSVTGAPLTGAAATVPMQSYSGEPGAPLFLGARFSVDMN